MTDRLRAGPPEGNAPVLYWSNTGVVTSDTLSSSYCTVRKYAETCWQTCSAPAWLVNVKNWTVAGAGGAKTKVRGIEMRILGAPAFQVYLPNPVTITRWAWTVNTGASTMNDPKYAMVAPETWKMSPLTFIMGRLPSTSIRSSSWKPMPPLR